MNNGLQFVVLGACMSLALVCTAQESLPSFKNKKLAAEKPVDARGPLVVGAEQELEQARRNYNEALKRSHTGESNRIASTQLKHELDMAEIRLRKAIVSESRLPEKHKIVLRRDLDTALAKSKYRFASSNYETVKRLYGRGSKTKRELQRARYAVKISKLELESAQINASDLSNSEKINRLNELEIESAQMEYDLSLSEYELMKKLYSKSTVSKQRALYYKYLVQVAKIDLVSAKLEASGLSAVEKKFKQSDLTHAKAKAKHRFLKSVHETNAKLFQKGRLNRQQYLKSLESLNKAEIELDAAREASISEVET